MSSRLPFLYLHMSNPRKKLQYCRPDRNIEYFYPEWNAKVKISQKISINNHIDSSSSSNLPILYIKFQFDTLFTGRLDQEIPYGRLIQIKLFHSATYMSRDKFFRVIEDNFKKLWGDLFDKNERRVFIEDMIKEIHEIIYDKCNKGRQHLDVSIHMSLFASNIVKLLWKMENNEDVMKDDCIICFEEFGKREKEVICMPCSHIFHGSCITTWLQNGHSCPICRYDLRVK